MRVASFDIGKLNFAFCIEEFDEKELEGIKDIPVPARYNPDGTPTERMSKVLDAVYSNGKIILHKNLNLTKNCDPKQKLDPQTFHNMITELDKYIPVWDTCSIIVIEEQMAFGKKLNKMAVKLGQHCYSYFAFLYGKSKLIYEFPAYHKTQVLGAEKEEGKPYKNGKKRYKAVDKPKRKKWAVEKALEILNNRAEVDIIEEMGSKKKKDDLADTFLQLQAFKYKMFIEKSM